MFDPGTKVILMDSSLSRTTGPRKGSIGYVSNCSSTMVIPLTKEDKSFSVVSSVREIVFIRFGFEEHGRMERKAVISLFPLIKNGKLFNNQSGNDEKKSISNINGDIRELCEMISSQRNTHLWDVVRESCDTSPSIAITMAVPLNYDSTNLITCDAVEFKSWLMSFLSSTLVANLAGRAYQSKHFTNSNDNDLKKHEMWDYLYGVTTDRELRANYIKTRYKEKEEREKCILLMRKIASMLNHIRLKTLRGVVEGIPLMISHDFADSCYDSLGPFLYNKIAMGLFYKTLISYTSSKNLIRVAEDMIAGVSECLSISESMLSSNKGFGYISFNSK